MFLVLQTVAGLAAAALSTAQRDRQYTNRFLLLQQHVRLAAVQGT